MREIVIGTETTTGLDSFGGHRIVVRLRLLTAPLGPHAPYRQGAQRRGVSLSRVDRVGVGRIQTD
jgi:hypothetical protein